MFVSIILIYGKRCVWSVAHLLGGYFMDHSTFCGKYNFDCDYKQYKNVLKCIPKAFVLL